MRKLNALLLLAFAALPIIGNAGEISFWDIQRKGANFFPNRHMAKRFNDASGAGIVLARLACNKWLNGRPQAELGNFLLGPMDNYNGIVQKDLKYLQEVLDDANKAGLKVVLTMLSLPGSRWAQHNIVEGKRTQQFDLWRDFKFHKQAASFWRDLAATLKNHPAIVGYNILNEPCPERATSARLRDWYTMDYQKWHEKVKGTPTDINLFYRTVIQAIREVDKNTPIILDSGFYANPYAFQILNPKEIDESRVLYSFHSYEPSHFTSNSTKGKYLYPGRIPTGELDAQDDSDADPPFAPVEHWDRKKFDSYFKVVNDWCYSNKIPGNRILVGEFGADRTADNVVEFFKDSIDFFNSQKWHWCFYSYREDDGFPKMDYELGTGPLPKGYWKNSEDYTCKEAGLYPSQNRLWKVLSDGLKKTPTNDSQGVEEN